MDTENPTDETAETPDVNGAQRSSGLPDLTTLQGAHEQIANLEIAVGHRTVIGQAIGILMERFDVDSEHAFALLKRVSQDKNIKLYALATELAETPPVRYLSRHPGGATTCGYSTGEPAHSPVLKTRAGRVGRCPLGGHPARRLLAKKRNPATQDGRGTWCTRRCPLG